jgi:hypothetical protein
MGDFDRRVLVARQAPSVEKPEERQPKGGFRHPDLFAYVQREHPRFLAHALTVLRAYVVAGQPSHGLPPLGSFEGWDGLIRGASIWSGIGDPLECRTRIESADEDREQASALLEAWHSMYGGEAYTVAGAFAKAPEDGALRLALAAFDAKGDAKRPNIQSIGNRLKSLVGRLVGGKRLERVGKGSPATYRVGLGPLVGLDTPGAIPNARNSERGVKTPETPEAHGMREPGEEG